MKPRAVSRKGRRRHMTITSTGPSGFHLKPLVSVFAVATIAAGVLTLIQVTGSDSPQRAPAPAEVSTEVAEPYSGPSGLSQALAEGKLDAGLTSAEGQPFAGSARVPEIVVVEGHGNLYDALVQGKFDTDFSPGDPAVQYVLIPAAAIIPSGSSEAFAAGKFDAGLIPEPSNTFAASQPAREIVVVEGQGGLHDALIEGKLTMDNAGVQYVESTETTATNSGLRAAFDADKFDEGVCDGGTVPLSAQAPDTPTVSGGHQE